MKKGDPTSLGTERIRLLIPQYAIPSIIAMLATSLYNVVDSIFIGQGCGPLAIAGLAICFPMMNLSAAFGAMVGVGASTVIGIRLGQKDYEGAEYAIGNVVILNVIIGTLFMLVYLIFLDEILIFFGASENTLTYARDSMIVLLWGNIITHLYHGLTNVLRATGYPQRAMGITIFSVIINILFNYIFIFVLEMGIMGAAIGTICAQSVALLAIIYHFSRPNTYLRFKRHIFKFRSKMAGEVISIGASSFFNNCCACLVVLLINNSLKQYGGDLYIGAYGIANRIVMIFAMVAMGLHQGIQPIVSFNFGARQFERFLKTFKLGVICATLITFSAFIAGELFARPIVKLFTTDEQLIEYSCHAMHIMVVVFPLVGFQMVSIAFFTAIGKAKKAIFLSLTRQLIFLIPMLLILPPFFGTDGVWMSMPISDMLSVVTVSIMIYFQIKQLRQEIALSKA